MAITPPNFLGAPVNQWGTDDIFSLLRVKNTSILDFGLQDIEQYAQIYLDEYNTQTKENMSFFVEDTNLRAEGIGGQAPMKMIRNNEYGRADAQKVTGANQLGYPLDRKDVVAQWTSDWFEHKTPHDLAQQVINMVAADAREVRADIQRALFSPTNYTYYDENVDGMPVFVKALANADGFPIPPSPNGKTFNPNTHTHYMGTAGANLAATDLDALVNNVTEHDVQGRTLLLLPSSLEPYMSGNIGNFPLYQRLVYTSQVPGILNTHMEGTLDLGNTINRRVGTYRDAEVWVKPWVPDGFLICIHADGVKPLARRTQSSISSNVAPGDFRMIYEASSLPLGCRVMRREHGFGVKNRVAAAVMSIGSPVYTAPTNFYNAISA